VRSLTPVTGAGVTALLAAMPIRQTLMGGAAVKDFTGARTCKAGETWTWDQIHFRTESSCTFDIETVHTPARSGTSSVELLDASNVRWTVLSGRSQRTGRRQNDTHVLATGDAGAVHVTLDPRSETVRLESLRSTRPALWRTFPHLARGSV